MKERKLYEYGHIYIYIYYEYTCYEYNLYIFMHEIFFTET